jgi:hypothetical protein
MDSKPWYLSKTILVQLLGAIAIIAGLFSPSVGAFIKDNFSEVGAAWAIVNVVLRLVTKDQVSIS